MTQAYSILPSILSADFARLGEEVSAVVGAGADGIHIDVMDHHYVPNLTFGPCVCAALRDYGVEVPLDVHLMTRPVDDLITAFARAGAHAITFHPEASDHVDRSIDLIHDLGCEAGLAINPATALSCLDYVLEKIDSVLVMSVNPGFAGQRFIPSTLEKIRLLSEKIQSTDRAITLRVDGGIHPGTILAPALAGADSFVAGSAIFHADDYGVAIDALRTALQEAEDV